MAFTEATGSSIDYKEVTVNQEYSVLYDVGDNFENWFVKISPNTICVNCEHAHRRRVQFESKIPFKIDLHTYYRCGVIMNDYMFLGDKGKITLFTHTPSEDAYEGEIQDKSGGIILESEGSLVNMNIPFEIAYLAQMIVCGLSRDDIEEYVEESDTLYKLR